MFYDFDRDLPLEKVIDTDVDESLPAFQPLGAKLVTRREWKGESHNAATYFLSADWGESAADRSWFSVGACVLPGVNEFGDCSEGGDCFPISISSFG